MTSSQSSSDLPPPPVSQIRSIFEGIAAKSATNNSPASKVVPLPQPNATTSRDRSPKSPTREDHPSTATVDFTKALKRPPPPLPTSAPFANAGTSSSSEGGGLAASALPAEYPLGNVPTSSTHSAPLVPSRLQTKVSGSQPTGILNHPSGDKETPFTESPVVETTPNVRPSAMARPAPSAVPPRVPPRSAQLSRHSTGSKLHDNSNEHDEETVQATLSSAAAALAQRKAPPPPPARRPFTSSRSPSPQPPSPRHSDPPELPARVKAPALGHTPSNSRDARSAPLIGELDDNSSFATTSASGSSLLSKTSSLTSYSGLDEPTDEVDRNPGLGARRGSMPLTVLHHEQLAAHPLERAVTEAPVMKTQPPAPPPRIGLGNRPNVPPRPPTRNITPTQHLTVPNHAGSPTRPPLPARGGGDRTSLAVSDDDASSASSATAIPNGAPLPPPRRTVPLDTSTSATPPPAHPAIGKGLVSSSPIPPQGAKLYSAINKVRNALPLTQVGPGLRNSSVPRSTSGGLRGHPATADNEGTDTLPAAPASPLPPPPVRTIALGDKLPPRRHNTAEASPLDEEGDSASSSGMEDNETPSGSMRAHRPPQRQPLAPSPIPSSRKGLDDLPDSSRSNRRPPFASFAKKEGDVLGLPAPHKSVYAFGGGALCVGKHTVDVYRLADLQERTPHNRRHRFHHHHRHHPSTDSSSSSSSSSASSSPGPSSVPRPVHSIHVRDVAGLQWRADHPGVTAMEFAPSRTAQSGSPATSEVGRFLWCGTKDGHLWELDTWTGEVSAIKNGAHGAAVIHILRYKNAMVTIDEKGKALVFGTPNSPSTTGTVAEGQETDDPDGWTDVAGGPILMNTAPRIVRVTEKQAFARILYGQLWTSTGSGIPSGEGPTGPSGSASGISGASSGGTGGRGPIIRVYDVFSISMPSRENSDTTSFSPNGSLPPPTASSLGRAATLLLTEAGVGAVTSATVLVTKPGLVYVGHEGGYVTVWDVSSVNTTAGADATAPTTSPLPPKCIQTLKVATTDIVCLEGVHGRLWAGSRNGFISAYDVEHRPWMATNIWKHGGYVGSEVEGDRKGLPVLRLLVDYADLEKNERLTVVSVGRDEVIRFWDGFLSSDWMDYALEKREKEFSSFRPMKVLVCTWNVDAAKPETLNSVDSTGGVDNIGFLDNVLSSVERPDILVFGFQEVIDLESKKMTAKTVLFGSDNAHKVSRSYKLWYDRLVYAVRVAMPPDCPYSVIHTENLVGLFTCIFVRSSEKESMRDMAITTVKRGMGGHYGNKGAIVSRFVLDDSSFCFINCHLAAGQSEKSARNSDLAAVLEERSVFPEALKADQAVVFAGGGDGSMILDHEFVFLNGDLNYRIDQRRDAVLSSIRAGDLQHLLGHDQLLKEMTTNRAFRLRIFHEAPITFLPTYKYDRHSNEYDSSEKRRIPAWCDRILWRCRDASRVETLHYGRYEVNVSDHRPVSAGFVVRLKKVDYAARSAVEAEVSRQWLQEERKMVQRNRLFYAEVGWI